MAGALLVENKIHHEYWRKKSGTTTIASTETATYGTEEGFAFGNCVDDNGATSFRAASGKQAFITITFPVSTTMNGFAIYGHNLTRFQKLRIKYDTDTSGSITSSFTGTPYSSTDYAPDDNLYKPFGAVFDTPLNVRRITIETIGWGNNSYISILALGHWVTNGINVTSPFTPPSFSPYESSIKRNNKGNFLMTDVKKVTQKLKINLTQFSEEDLYAVTDSAQYTKINGLLTTHPFIEYAGYFISRHPFFFMYNNGNAAASGADKIIDQQKIYFCTVDKGLQQPRFSSPTQLSWTIDAIGYIE
jgi:hypothetical protein